MGKLQSLATAPSSWTEKTVKERIDALCHQQGRQLVYLARELGLSRELLNQRLLGIVRWRPDEPRRIAGLLGVPLEVIWTDGVFAAQQACEPESALTPAGPD